MPNCRDVRQQRAPIAAIEGRKQVKLHLPIATPGPAEAAAKFEDPACPQPGNAQPGDDQRLDQNSPTAATHGIAQPRQPIRQPEGSDHRKDIGLDQGGHRQQRRPGHDTPGTRPRHDAEPQPQQQQELPTKRKMPAQPPQQQWLQDE